MEVINESIYDHPKYYDLVFGSDVAAELNFIADVNAKHMNGKAAYLFEPACGTGRLMFGLARQGFQVAGIDLNEKAVDFANERLDRRGYKPSARVADMSDFRYAPKWDLAFNTINSFRHLTTPKTVRNHLACMAAGTKKNGVYLIGLHLTPTTVEPMDEESWSASRGHLTVNTFMWTNERAPRKRIERFGIRFDIYTPTRQFRIMDELVMRSYTYRQFQTTIDRQGDWEIEAVYDFRYDITKTVEVDSSSEDVVYVLRKK